MDVFGVEVIYRIDRVALIYLFVFKVCLGRCSSLVISLHAAVSHVVDGDAAMSAMNSCNMFHGARIQLTRSNPWTDQFRKKIKTARRRENGTHKQPVEPPLGEQEVH